jgi:hypothetical protein
MTTTKANMVRDGSIQCTCRSDDAEHEIQCSAIRIPAFLLAITAPACSRGLGDKDGGSGGVLSIFCRSRYICVSSVCVVTSELRLQQRLPRYRPPAGTVEIAQD